MKYLDRFNKAGRAYSSFFSPLEKGKPTCESRPAPDHLWSDWRDRDGKQAVLKSQDNLISIIYKDFVTQQWGIPTSERKGGFCWAAVSNSLKTTAKEYYKQQCWKGISRR